MNQSSDNILYLDIVPHEWLLPRCKLIVHHGGAETTSAGLCAGIPNIMIPFAADQPFWGGRVHRIGAVPKPISVEKLSVEGLMQAILKMDDPALCRRAQNIGQGLRTNSALKILLT